MKGAFAVEPKKDVVFYNILFPVWMMIFIPSLLWLLLFPANYLIDHLVVYLSNPDFPKRGEFCKKNVWKICLAGFGCDFAGALVLFIFGSSSKIKWLEAIADGINSNPFQNTGSFAFVLTAVLISAVLIYIADRSILENAGFDHERAARTARNLAVFTAPYLFFLPADLIY